MDYCGPVRNAAEYEQVCDLVGKVYVRNSYYDLSGRMRAVAQQDPYFTYEHSRITIQKGHVTSHVAIRERELFYGESVITMGGIADVATDPAFRGQGQSRLLMEDAVRFMEKRGLHLSMLYGIPRYYHKFGYIESLSEYKIHLPVRDGLLATPSLKTRPAEKRDIPALARLYEANFKGVPLAVKRPAKYWNMNFRIAGAMVAVDKNNRVHGYVIPLAGGEPQTLGWKETAFDKAEAAWTLINYCSKAAAEKFIGQIAFHISPAALLVEYLMELGGTMERHDNRQSAGGPMFRIINLKGLFEAISPELSARVSNSSQAGRSYTLAFLTDIGFVRLLIDKDRVKVGRTKSGARDLVIKIPQVYLTRLVTGFRSLEQISRLPGVQFPKQAHDIMNVLFPKSEAHLTPVDYF